MSQYTLREFESIGDPDVWECPTCESFESESYRAVAQHHRHCKEGDIHFLHDYFGLSLERAYRSGVGLKELSRRLDVDGKTVRSALESLEVPLRDHSDSVKVWLENLDGEKRHAALYGGQEKAAQTLVKWREENFDQHTENALRNLPEPTSGPDNPCWKGGKSLRDKLTKIYGERSWGAIRREVRQRQDHKCGNCGSEPSDGQSLDVHHIVPVLAGGTNHPDNLIALCKRCHYSSERYTAEKVSPHACFKGD